MQPGVHQYDPFDKKVMANPLPYYEVLRREAPVLYLEKYDTFVFSRFQDIWDILGMANNTFVASDTTLPTPELLMQHNKPGTVREWPLDPLPIGAILPSPHYDVLRRAHIKPFRPISVTAIESFVRDITRKRLAELLPKKRFDLTQDFGGILSASVVCSLFDMSLELAPEVLELVNELSLTDPEQGGTDIAVTVARCVELMKPYIAKRRAAGADGTVPLIDGLINLDYYDRPLTDDEIATQLTCTLVGGTETVPKITAHGLMELANHPEQLAEVRKDLKKNVPLAVEEMIRFCAPAQWFVRTAHTDVTVAGQFIRRGQRVLVLFGSAARDEAEFDRPNEFIWNRDIKRVLSFGLGQHHCIGVHLARLELKIFVEEFLAAVPHYSFDMAGAVRLPSSFQWGWNKLPVIIGD